MSPRPKRKHVKFRVNLQVVTSNWDTGDWPDDLAKAMEIKVNHDEASVTFAINPETWEAAARKVAKEAIEAFFGEGMHVSLSKEGVLLTTSDGLDILIRNSEIWCDMGPADRDILVRALNASPYQMDGSHDMFDLDELVKMATKNAEAIPKETP